jgi:mitochondrial intermediate peptidase
MAGVLGLHTPEDFNRLAKLAVRNCEVARQRLHSGTSGGPLQELRDLDSISNTVCSIVDAAEFARNNHADPAFREAAEETFAALR